MSTPDPRRASPVRLAIAGLGLVGQRHADAIAQVAGATLCAVVDTGPQAGAEAARRGIPLFADLDEMIAAERPDGIILSTPTPLHAAQGLRCVAAGIPALIEKPLADDLDAARDLVEQAEAANVPLLVGHHRRHNPLIRQAKALIDAGQIGTVRAVQATCWFYKPDAYFDAAPWRKLRGAGPISVNLVHDVDLIRHLCGEVVSVQAQAAPSQRGFENEDVAAALLTFDTGAIGTITVSDSIVAPWSWEMTSREYPVYPATGQSAYQIGGSHGSLSIPDLTVWSHGAVRDWWTPISATSVPQSASDPLVNQIAQFVAVIAGTETPLVSGREGLRSLAVVDAIQASARTGQTVQLRPRAEADRS
ncbi:Gfo/Idh/MocA family protein [Thalassococcus sp. BH17M4-6]|uniref:Gfo/Idh/MocA family protein n=1 Tax=Thalassococcus sp. BH17M4-6 TaxID=3413148 RepID=UPI003BC0C35E